MAIIEFLAVAKLNNQQENKNALKSFIVLIDSNHYPVHVA